ncbi:MAG: radical SAM protein [Proteobacteria bacterium]|jgi:sulfatase maturation enzyme AslB (radical SAM superfamily)|nr:radical SAM protein [Pseudomonadota bacterium]
MTDPPSDKPSAPAPSDKPVWERRDNLHYNQIRDNRRNVEINIGKACNNRCVFCVDGVRKKEDRSYLPKEEMFAEIERFAASGHQSLGFLGGEPTTYRWLPESVEHARKHGFTRIVIATNATRLRKPEYADRLLDAGLTRVTVSIHGHTAELEDKQTRVPGNFDKKVVALKYLVAQRAAGYLIDGVSVNIVLNGWNYRYLPKMMKFFYDSIGVQDIRVNFMRPEGYAEGNRELSAPYTVVVPIMMKAILLAEYHWKDKTFTFGGFPLCVLPRQLRDSDHLLKKYMGEYRDLSTDCSVRQDGNGVGIEQVDQKTQRSRFNWQERKRYDLKSPVRACGSCTRVELCEGIWNGYLHIHGEGEFRSI